MKTPFQEIFDKDLIGRHSDQQKINQILGQAMAENMSPSVEDPVKTLFLAIDMQNDFMENGELAVPGSHADVYNAARFLYEHMEKITHIAVSLDTHQPQQIFHPGWWVDQNGNHPTPFTIISADEVQNGVWKAVRNQAESLEYAINLKKKSRKDLCIWPYHCLEGTFGAALESQFGHLVYFHSVARNAVTERLVKGKDPLSEMYGIIRPEYDLDNYYNHQFLHQLATYDRIIIAGEAKSHCVLESVRQILEHFADNQKITSRLYLLEDCMSSIPGFEEITEQAFELFRQEYKVNIMKSTELAL